MKRNVIEINEDKCIGCGLCAGACMQGAIEIIDGKAKLVSESYCDGLGMCLPKCPVDAIHVVEKETEEFDSTRKNIKATPSIQPMQTAHAHTHGEGGGCGCSGSAAKSFDRSVSFTLDTAPKAETKRKRTYLRTLRFLQNSCSGLYSLNSSIRVRRTSTMQTFSSQRIVQHLPMAISTEISSKAKPASSAVLNSTITNTIQIKSLKF